MTLSKLIIFALISSVLAQTNSCPRNPPRDNRRDCGYPGINPSECRSLGCCYDTRYLGVPWCFRPPAPPAYVGSGLPYNRTTAPIQYSGNCLFHCTSIHREDRNPCQAGGIIGERACVESGCCFDTRESDPGRRCYRASTSKMCPLPECQIPSGSMSKCAGYTVSRRECEEQLNCCAIEMGPFNLCYHKEAPPRILIPGRPNRPNRQNPNTAVTFSPSQTPPTTTTAKPLSFIQMLRKYNGGTLEGISVLDILTKTVPEILRGLNKTIDGERGSDKLFTEPPTTTTTTTTVSTTTRITTPTTAPPPPVTRIMCNFFRRCRSVNVPTPPPRTCMPEKCGEVFFYPGSTIKPATANRFKKIVGGTRAHPFSHPWTAMLLKEEGGRTFLCGAAIICEHWLVTSAHCMNKQTLSVPQPDLDVIYYTVYVGRYTGWQRKHGRQVQVFKGREGIDFMEQHELFTPGVSRGVITNDIGVIRLKRPIVFNQFVQPICLPKEPVPVNKLVFASGWGVTKGRGPDDSALKQVAKMVLNKTKCDEDVPRFREADTNGILCAGGEQYHDTCIGDSGGPLVNSKVVGRTRNGRNILQWELVGLTSLGSPSCNTLRFDRQPALYTDIYYYLPWIKARTHNCCRMW